jgi:Protein of unknown function (DUF2442)
MTHRIIRILALKVVASHTLWLRFDDGVERTVDLSLVLAGEIYEPLRDPQFFGRVRLDPEIHTVVWPNGADFDPEALYDWPNVQDAWKARADAWNQERQQVAGLNEAISDEAISGSGNRRNLDALAGTWSEKDAQEFDQAVSDFGKIDEGLWK